MRVLVTNDDGLNSQGLHVLVETLAEMAEIFVVAPDRERSGTGHGITVFDPIMIKRVDGVAGAQMAWVVYGTPVDCVKLGISSLLPAAPDLVVSGINKGANLGWDVLYSGTVSAAMEGVIMGVPSIAVSLCLDEALEDYGFAARFTRAVSRQMEMDGFDRDTIININVPGIPRPEIKGVRVTRLGRRQYENVFEERKDPRGNIYYWMGGDVVEEDQEPDSDVTAVNQGFVSLTPIHFDLTNYNLVEKYRRNYHDYVDHI